MKDKSLKDAFQGWDELSSTQEERLAYEGRLKRVLDEEAAVREAELREQEARERALREGREEGLREGHREGERKSLISSSINFLTVTFPDKSLEELQQRMESITNVDELETIQIQLFKAESWSDVEKIIDNMK